MRKIHRTAVEYLRALLVSDDTLAGTTARMSASVLGTVPSQWFSASIVEEIQVDDNKFHSKAQILIGPGQPLELVPGRYRVWVEITDAPETIIVSVDEQLRIT